MSRLTSFMPYVVIVVLVVIYLWSHDSGRRRRVLRAIKLLITAGLLAVDALG